MEDINLVYDKLKNLYSKESSMDSLTKGVAIEDIVRKLLRDIVEPFPEYEDVALFNRRFDGSIPLGRGSDVIIFEIKLGYLPDFELERLINSFYDIKFGKPLFLFIAYGLSEKGKVLLNALKKDIPISFIDFENLIELHKFVRQNIKIENSTGLKIKKKYFLQALLKENKILNKSSFNEANLVANDRFEVSSQTKVAYAYVAQSSFKEFYKERLEKLEYLAKSLLEEIQALKQQSESEK